MEHKRNRRYRRWPKGTWMKLLSRETLRALMAQRGFTRRRLARYCGLKGSGMIDHLLDGRKGTCSPRLAERIVEALDVPLEVLFVPNSPSDTMGDDKRTKVSNTGGGPR